MDRVENTKISDKALGERDLILGSVDGCDPTLRGAVRAFALHDFFQGLELNVVEEFARTSYKRSFPCAGHNKSEVLVSQNVCDWGHEHLWVVEKGSVVAEESGEVLSTLGEGAVFGDAVAFGRMGTHPFTVTTAGPLSVWCIPQREVQFTVRSHPEVRHTLEERMDRQTLSLFNSRLSKLCLFSHCSTVAFQQMVRTMKVAHFKPQAVLFEQRDPADSMVVLMHGSCKIVNSKLNARRATPAIHVAPTSPRTRKKLARTSKASDEIGQQAYEAFSRELRKEDSGGEENLAKSLTVDLGNCTNQETSSSDGGSYSDNFEEWQDEYEEENEEQDEEEQEVQEEQTEEEGEKGEKQESLKQGLNEDLDHKKEGQMEDYDDDDYKDDDDENDDDKEEEDIDAYVKGAKFGLPAHKEVLAPRSSTTPIIPGSNRRPVPVRRSPTLVAGDGESAWRPTLRHLRPHTSNSRPH